MIITFISANNLHAIYVIHQKSMTKISARSICNEEADAGAGILQVPDWVFDGRPKYNETTTVCPKCIGFVAASKVPPK